MYYRLFRPEDAAACHQLLPKGYKASARVLTTLPRLWQRLLDTGHLHGGVVIDPDTSNTDAIAAFGMSMFVDPAFVDEYLREPKPFLSAIVYERMLDGRSPILPAGRIASANASGRLNLLILHFGIRLSNPASPRELAIVAAAHAGFRTTHEGYHVERIMQEVYSRPDVDFMRAGGFRLEHDFSAHRTIDLREPSDGPFLMGVSTGDPEARLPGAAVSYLFHRQKPRFRFTPAEQRILQRTLLDETDESIAEDLGISRDAVKKLWRSIYQRVAALDPSVLDDGDGSSESDVSAGRAERRRHVIRYLRYHLEELRRFKYAR